jgi:hypothetical protein
MADPDPLQTAMLQGASRALRRRGARQMRIAADGTTVGERGATIRSGEPAIALRLAAAFTQLADDLEEEATP